MLKAISRVLFWTYPRGSWQYDLMCIAILLFIFLTPRWVFDSSYSEETAEQAVEVDGARRKSDAAVEPQTLSQTEDTDGADVGRSVDGPH